MAITGRAARDITLDVHNTPDVVGPGSYLSVQRDAAIHGFAPFCSTVERKGPAEAGQKTKTPGPGVYSNVDRPKAATEYAGASFMSRVNRMPAPEAAKPHRLTPGPGTYALLDNWDAAGSYIEPVANPNTGKMRDAVIPKQAHAPSIPVADQSYGYEEGVDGELKMQAPPRGGYDGVSGHRSAGPGEYEPTKASRLTKPMLPSAHFGNSRVTRNLFSYSAKHVQTPGPGAYMGQPSTGAPLMGQAGGPGKASAAFMSRVPLDHQRLIDSEKLAPGPGAYAADAGIMPKVVPENLQTFGSTQKRLASDAITPNERAIMAQPGPGAYEERRSDFKKAMDEKAGRVAAEAAPGMQGFNSSTQRFKPLTKRTEPGPGAYNQLDQYTFVADLQRKTHGRHGVFGSTTRRFHSLKRDQVPGAGTYDPAMAGEAYKEEREDQNSSAFASSVTRFAKSAPSTIVKGKKQPAEMPPPWKYNVKSQNMWDQQQSDLRHDQTFGTKVERFPRGEISGGKVRPVPGPGAYHPKEGQRKQQTTTECFGSRESRFVLGQRGIFSGTNPTPGPGQYDSSVEMNDPMIKRSFNITIG